jgi:nucleotide-binding universal stress UspA family protein
MILLAYDGSADARAAIENAAELFADQPVTVLTVWEPFVEVVARTTVGFGMVPSIPDSDELDAASSKHAEQIAAEGVELAQKLGLDAKPLARAQETTTAGAILAEADRLDASAIVMGSRGLTGLKSVLLGSVSHELIQHADRTVAVVPSPGVAASRARKFREAAQN